MAHDVNAAPKLRRKKYERELFRLQTELVKLQEWVKPRAPAWSWSSRAGTRRARAARSSGSPSTSTRASRGSWRCPRRPSGERSQWYFQRYVEHLPAAGEIVLFDRSWYNRAGVEWVMGFCTKEEHQRFLHQCPIFERLLVEDGILLRKYWFSVSDAEQERRFSPGWRTRCGSWKLSPMDLESITRWEDYSRAKDEMFVHTDIPEAPWYVVESDDKRRRADQHDRPPALDHPVRAGPEAAADAAGPAAVERIPAHPAGDADVRARPRWDRPVAVAQMARCGEGVRTVGWSR